MKQGYLALLMAGRKSGHIFDFAHTSAPSLSRPCPEVRDGVSPRHGYGPVSQSGRLYGMPI